MLLKLCSNQASMQQIITTSGYALVWGMWPVPGQS